MSLPLTAGKHNLTLAGAKKVADAAEEYAQRNSLSVVIAIMDDGGNLMYLRRMDNAPIGSVTVAQDKARTSVIFKARTEVFEGALASGLTSLLKLDILPFAGGVPIIENSSIVAAIGVSGCATSAEDGKVAQAGADWFSSALASG